MLLHPTILSKPFPTAHRSAYVWLFQAPLLPEAPIAANDILAPSSSLDFLKD